MFLPKFSCFSTSFFSNNHSCCIMSGDAVSLVYFWMWTSRVRFWFWKSSSCCFEVIVEERDFRMIMEVKPKAFFFFDKHKLNLWVRSTTNNQSRTWVKAALLLRPFTCAWQEVDCSGKIIAPGENPAVPTCSILSANQLPTLLIWGDMKPGKVPVEKLGHHYGEVGGRGGVGGVTTHLITLSCFYSFTVCALHSAASSMR